MNSIMDPYNSFSIVQSVYFVCKMEIFTNELLITFRNPVLIQTCNWINLGISTK